MGVLAREAVREFNEASSAQEVALVKLVSGFDVARHGVDEGPRKRRDPIFAAFAVAHADFTAREIEIFDSQARALRES
jgi:hypothetical protein